MGRTKKDKDEEIVSSSEKFVAKDIKSLLTKVINAKFAETVAYELGGNAPTNVTDWISTGCTLLDYICSNRRDGGIPCGKLTEIVGLESSGKSLICQHIAANTQRKGGFCIYIDTESSMNKEFAKRVGINIEDLFYAVPPTIEDVFETIEESVKKIRTVDQNVPITIIWDSVAGTPTKSEIEGTFNPQESIGVAARIISKAMRKIIDSIAKEKITLVFTNQLKAAIGKFGYGDPMSATYGGKAIPYHASLRIKMKKIGEVKIADQSVGISSEAKVIKSKIAPPFRSCRFPTLFSSGVDNFSAILEQLKSYKEIEQKGNRSVMTYKDEELSLTKGAFHDKMRDDKEFNIHCMNLIENHMIIHYDDSQEKKLNEIDVDPDSLIEVEAVNEALAEVEEE
jgi:recombination protein RecA